MRGVILRSVPAVLDIVLPLMLILSTCNAVSVPTDVIAVCAALVTVAAVPEVLPVTFPVRFPTNAVDVIEVAPVTTPASITIAPSNTICCPANGVMFKSVPAVEDMVFPFIFMLSTCRAVKVPRLVIFPCVAVCIVPVKLPTTFPSRLATKVAIWKPVPPVFTVVVGSASNNSKSLYLPLSFWSLNKPVN